MSETWVWSLGWEESLEKGLATHSSILDWRIPWTEEPGGLQSMGSQRGKHDWATFTLYKDHSHQTGWKLLRVSVERRETWPTAWAAFSIRELEGTGGREGRSLGAVRPSFPLTSLPPNLILLLHFPPLSASPPSASLLDTKKDVFYQSAQAKTDIYQLNTILLIGWFFLKGTQIALRCISYTVWISQNKLLGSVCSTDLPAK